MLFQTHYGSAHTPTHGNIFPCDTMVWGTSLQKEGGHQVTATQFNNSAALQPNG